MTEETIPSYIKPAKYPGGSEGLCAAERKETEEDSWAGQEKKKSTDKMMGAKNLVQAHGWRGRITAHSTPVGDQLP